MKMKLPLILTFLLLFNANAADEVKIDQKDRTFSTDTVRLKPGQSIKFANSDTVSHNVFSTSKANGFTIKIQKPGASSTVQFKDKGVTDVRCAIHPKMKLKVIVE